MKLKQIIATILAAAMMTALTACNSNGGEQPQSGSEESQSQSESTNGQKFKVGVIQLVQHDALDAATNGFVDALKEKFGDDVEVVVQNASGDSPTCGVIANQFVSEGVDLIMANGSRCHRQHSDSRNLRYRLCHRSPDKRMDRQNRHKYHRYCGPCAPFRTGRYD